MQGQLPEMTPEPEARSGRAQLRALRSAVRSRYRIREIAGVRSLVCVESPTISVRIAAGACVPAEEARSGPPGRIYLDGAAEGPPFADPVRCVYNLDHHEGCERAFTLSTCEQAMVLVRKGLELRSREWTVFANDADLDAILAIWVLFNHLRLRQDGDPVRSEVMPLLRLEGAIDAHGLEFQDFCALPPGLLDETRRRMDRLRDRERAIKASGSWQRLDLVDYVRERLEQIDSMVYPPRAFDDMVDIEELGRAELAGGAIAVACRARVGIYEVERQLRRLHGPRLELVVLKQRGRVYTLRQLGPTLTASLDSVYAHLNLVDPSASRARSGNRWGGSSEIGGSPRATGTRLTPQQILEACRRAWAPLSRRQRAAGVVRATLSAAPLIGIALVAPAIAALFGFTAPPSGFAVALTAITAPALALRGRHARGVYGLRWPRGTGWISAIPFAVVAGLAGGAWPAESGWMQGQGSLVAALAWLTAPVGAELLFRGLLHGRLVWELGPTRIGRRGREPLSAPVLLSAVLYASTAAALGNLGSPLTAELEMVAPEPLAVCGAGVLGLAAGLARERSESVLAAIAVHASAAAALAGVTLLAVG
jgi:hypothetical protein